LFIGLNTTKQKHGRRKKEITREGIKSYVLEKMYFRVNDEIRDGFETFCLKNWYSVAVSKSEALPEDGQLMPKHVAIDRDFNVILNEGEIVKTVLH
jgi:hypothetical protein